MRRRLVRWGMFLIAVIVVVLLVQPVVAVLRPDYYRRYPGLAHRMEHWSNSTHSRIACSACHVDPGVAAQVSFAVRSIPAYYSQRLWGPDSTNLFKPPGREVCQKCHTGLRRVSPGGDLLIPHQAHVEILGMDCVVCHKDLVHSLNRRGFNRPEMEGCVEQCHNGTRASNVCTECHTQKQAPATHGKTEWLQIHGQMAESGDDCGSCHDWTPDYCADCHQKRPASHISTWKESHAPHARTRGEGCLVCHGTTFCKRCH